MTLAAGCPRCPLTVEATGHAAGWACPQHGPVAPLWRAGEASYDDFAGHLDLADGVPTYLPWPLSPGWSVTDFGTVPGRATFTCVSGTSELDGPVDCLVVTEEPGTGLGARCSGTTHDDPGVEVGDGQPSVKVRLEGQPVPLWLVSTSDSGSEWDRTVLAGEGHGRWLWLVLRPASALLLLHESWLLRDVSALGPALVDVPFGGAAPSW